MNMEQKDKPESQDEEESFEDSFDTREEFTDPEILRLGLFLHQISRSQKESRVQSSTKSPEKSTELVQAQDQGIFGRIFTRIKSYFIQE